VKGSLFALFVQLPRLIHFLSNFNTH